MDKLSNIVPSGFLATWFADHGREFPWREKRVSPFQLLITEMLLRQTRASQVDRLWGEFMTQFGTPRKLVVANRNRLFDRVEELGFGNQRTEALTSAAEHVVDHHSGQVPNSKDELLNIPHIGLYGAHSILCFAYGKRVPIVDTNILRLFCRLLTRKVNRLDIRREPWAWDYAEALLPESKKEVIAHNYGLLDFTAAICKPRSPQCKACPLSRLCYYGQQVERGKNVTGLP